MSKKSDSRKDVDDVDDDEDDEGEDDEEGEDEERSHNAGRNCLTSGCHSGSGEKHFSIGGTIYADTDGADAMTGAKIKIVDTNGSTIKSRTG